MIKKSLTLMLLVSVASTCYAVPGVDTVKQGWDFASKTGSLVWNKVCTHKYGSLITAVAVAAVLTVYNVEGIRTPIFQLLGLGFLKKVKKDRVVRHPKCYGEEEGEEETEACPCELENKEEVAAE